MKKTALLHKLEDRFRELSLLLYDTAAPTAKVDAALRPCLAEEVRFVDPWQLASGKQRYRLGAAGFHALFSFHLEVFQVAIQLDERRSTGRAMVDSVMHLTPVKWLPGFPLRTILVYEFQLEDLTAATFKITSHEEMWSFAELISGAPGVGRFYDRVFRPGFAYGFLAASWVACRVRGMLPPLQLR